MMDSQAYYRIHDQTGCDRSDDDHYLAVNCTGVNVLSRPFTTWRPKGRHDYYLMYLYQGTLDIRYNGTAHTIQPGDLVFYSPGQETFYRKMDQSEMIYYWIHFTGYGASTLMKACRFCDSTVYTVGISRPVLELFHRLFENFLFHDRYVLHATSALLGNIMVQLGRGRDEQTGSVSQSRLNRISRSLDFIHQHYSHPLSIGQLAKIEHLSTSRYSALFHQCMGQSPQSFIINLRMQMAVEMILKTDLSIKQIAQMVGYEDQLYFSRLFRSRKGVPPSRYRQHAAYKKQADLT